MSPSVPVPLPDGLSGLVPRRSYPPAGKCIYCGALGAPSEKLGEEHIIPLSFGGNLVLADASCRRCERITTAIEDHCLKGLISTARPHLNIKGRQKRKNLNRGPVYLNQGTHIETTSAPLPEHPGMVIMPWMPYPTAMAGAALPNEDTPVAARYSFRPMTDDLTARSLKIDKRGTNLTKGISTLECYRLIAKIAHAFTAAELGVDNFRPNLLNLIRNEQPMFADHFVGSGLVQEPASGENLTFESGKGFPNGLARASLRHAHGNLDHRIA